MASEAGLSESEGSSGRGALYHILYRVNINHNQSVISTKASFVASRKAIIIWSADDALHCTALKWHDLTLHNWLMMFMSESLRAVLLLDRSLSNLTYQGLLPSISMISMLPGRKLMSAQMHDCIQVTHVRTDTTFIIIRRRALENLSDMGAAVVAFPKSSVETVSIIPPQVEIHHLKENSLKSFTSSVLSNWTHIDIFSKLDRKR